MIVKPTPHIEITNTEDLAKTVLMPGDPLRAKFIADKFLTNVKTINTIRNCLAFTGDYKGHKITIFASGMGQPSIGIYSYELFKFYGVERIIRIGSAGSYSPELNVYDTVLVKNAYSESTFAKVAYDMPRHSLPANKKLNKRLAKAAKDLGIKLTESNTHSSDVFYHDNPKFNWEEVRDKHKVSCVEMESFALFANAIHLGKEAACLLTISDSFITHEETTSEERRSRLMDMVKVALEIAQYD